MTDIEGGGAEGAWTGRLDAELEGTAQMVAALSGELARFRQSATWTKSEVLGLSQAISTSLRRAFDGVVFDGARLSDTLRGLGRAMSETVYRAAMKPVTGAAGALLSQGVNAVMSGLMPFADGAGFAQGRVMPFASGGIVTQPTRFAMRGGQGLMGEAGPEAIMPLTRGPDGRLGVQAQGGGSGARPVQVVIHVKTPDVAGFQRSQAQIAAQMGRILAQGNRNS